MRILIAEDERDLRELLGDNLSREGHIVFMAENKIKREVGCYFEI